MQSPITFFTIEEYLQLEQTSEIRHEYLGGQVFAMSGGSKEHNTITLNIASRVRSHLRGGSCSVFMADMKVRIELANQNKNIFYYPDVIVSCDSQDQDRFSLNYPCLIIEVLSPSTELTDRREKLVNYRNLETLQEYVLISQDEIKVEVYRKDAQGNWSLTILSKDDKLRLNSVGLTLTMADIYEDVIMDALKQASNKYDLSDFDNESRQAVR
ncbi:Uma2 family endonuclease [Fortiea sp. LEGE XX443]|uniref:Uma2 family endonuclease n=1 Tax=Fortiea sp. LEGE XX443 TaxID=1828611 RepID=UPI00187DF31D|nr:Uma2 family endonuclease [Fortiea sp. LEGE XX443]MBE9003698.1 Uma2 family endonuclease [Fortiea sp. LEGE XX443]